MGPTIDELAHEYEGKAIIGKVDTDGQPAIAEDYGVQALPTLIFFKDGKEVDRIEGAPPKEDLKNILDGLTAS